MNECLKCPCGNPAKMLRWDGGWCLCCIRIAEGKDRASIKLQCPKDEVSELSLMFTEGQNEDNSKRDNNQSANR